MRLNIVHPASKVVCWDKLLEQSVLPPFKGCDNFSGRIVGKVEEPPLEAFPGRHRPLASGDPRRPSAGWSNGKLFLVPDRAPAPALDRGPFDQEQEREREQE